MSRDVALELLEEGKYSQARSCFEELLKTSNSVEQDDFRFNIATCYAREGELNKALVSLGKCVQSKPDATYNLALCNYKLGLFDEANSLVDDIISSISLDHPEFLDADKDESNEIEAGKLSETLLIQSINLKAAILYKQHAETSRSLECLSRIPIKSIDQYDCVTLHNIAIYESEMAPFESEKKLEHLVTLIEDIEMKTLVPKETLRNLLLLQLYHKSSGSANLLIRDKAALFEANIDASLASYFRCCFEAKNDQILFDRLDRISQSLIREQKESPLLGIICSQQATLLWNNDLFEELEDYLLKTKPYTRDLDTWSINLANTLFMQDTRYEECTTIYEELMMSQPRLEDVDPLILCNLCISYVLSGKNDGAETLIKEVEGLEANLKEDFEVDYDALSVGTDASSTSFMTHETISKLLLINLAIGTLYCVKYNYEFGLTRILKALVPLGRKLNPETWYITKRCILAILSSHCRQIVCLRDDLFDQVIQFLMQCERLGRAVPVQPAIMAEPANMTDGLIFHGRGTVTHEARLLRSIVVKIFHD